MIKIRLAKIEDSKDIFKWRNDFHTRKMFHSSKIVEWNEHKKWFEKNLMNRKVSLLICTNMKEEKVGVIRFDVSDNVAEVSINLNPTMRGKAKASECLKKSINFVKRYSPNLKVINAEIKDINLASKKTFEKVGFVFQFENKGIRHYKMFF